MYVVKKPYFGAQIRVNRGLYYHHGIYADDMHVIHFASSVPGHETDPAYARVEETTLEKFLKGGTLEVREYSDYEKKKLRSPEEIVSYAYKEIGRGGYNIVTNNCEHFLMNVPLVRLLLNRLIMLLMFYRGYFQDEIFN
ncbi:MAG: hypothetical protein BHW10_05365 [Clostridium sp. CAG:307_30_263]|nr:MAG: hypothetical protein BHW10_05365 [Clostridium sp. CAG:307_30_263]